MKMECIDIVDKIKRGVEGGLGSEVGYSGVQREQFEGEMIDRVRKMMSWGVSVKR